MTPHKTCHDSALPKMLTYREYWLTDDLSVTTKTVCKNIL